MNYKNIYQLLVSSRNQRTLIEGEVYEDHHILPVSLGGTNNPDNIVTLTIREHFIAHLLLTKITEGKDKLKMMFAFGMMSVFSKSNSGRLNVPSRLFELARKSSLAARLELYASVDYVSPNKGSVWYTDGERRMRLKPNNLLIETLNLQICNPTKGKKWYSDGTKFFMLFENDERIEKFNLFLASPGKNKPKKFSNKVKQDRKEMLWFNDGVTSTKLKPTDPRVIGLTRGRVKFSDTAIENFKTACSKRDSNFYKDIGKLQFGKRYFNDGQKNYFLNPSNEIPPHLVKGRIKCRQIQ